METNTSITEKTLFFHGTSVEGKRFTLAAKFKDDAMLLGIAICGPGDQFTKYEGRKKSEGRLRSNGFKGCSVASLYSDKHFSAFGTDLGLVQDWYVGKELSVFITFSNRVEQMTFKEIKRMFNFLN